MRRSHDNILLFNRELRSAPAARARGSLGSSRWFRALSVALLGLCAWGGGGAGCAAQQVKPAKGVPAAVNEASPQERIDKPGEVMGPFRLPAGPAHDGDTIRVVGVKKSLRLLGIDTEELFRSKADRRDAERDFYKYLRQNRGDAPRPRKTGTPLGEEAKQFARDFFRGEYETRLERDEPYATRGSFGRYLAYVFVKKRGKWVNYNIECVRAGMSPYFTKYGYSRRFHREFVQAEEEARTAERGIWSPEKQHYMDYPERKAWWDARANFIESYRHGDAIFLRHDNAMELIQARVGKTVTVVSTVEAIQHFGGMRRVLLGREGFAGFPIIFFDGGIFEASGIGELVSEWVAVRGEVSEYRKGAKRQLQIVVKEANQVQRPALPPSRATLQPP